MVFGWGGFTTTCEIRRPWNGSVVQTDVPCGVVPRLAGQRIGGTPPPMYYTHIMMVGKDVDLRDAANRQTNQPTQTFGAAGDEVRIPSGSGYGARYIVVWVERVHRGLPWEFKRVYLARDAVQWGTANAP